MEVRILRSQPNLHAHVAQLVEAPGRAPGQCAFESRRGHVLVPLAQMVSAPARQAGGRRFEPGTGREGRVAEWSKAQSC